MRRYKILFGITCLTFLFFQTQSLYAQAFRTKYVPPQHKANGKSWMKDQDDQTDTYAIPLDSSEEEERQEERTLQKYQNKNKKDSQEYKCNADGKCSAD